MACYTSTTSVVCSVMICSLLVGLAIAYQNDADGVCDSGADCTRSRQRRSTCSGSTYTISRLIDIIEELEKKNEDNTAEDNVRYLRKFINPLKWPSITKKYRINWHLLPNFWNYVCGQIRGSSMPNDALTKGERNDLAKMIIHGNDENTGTETGVVLTKRSGTVAAGHVITGISCGGFNRDTQLSLLKTAASTSSHLDNLFVVTISGDMGQTSLQFYSTSSSTHRLFGPSGQWDDPSCPKVYAIPSPVSELTEAEINGDMDGVILGTLIPMIKDRHWKLSRIFRDYYQNGGIQVGTRWFSDENRAENFGELVSDVELEAQSKAFAKIYYGLHKNDYNGASLPSLLRHVHEAVQTFYADYVPRTNVLERKYTIGYFVKLLKELERAKGFGVVDMTQAIVSVSEYFKSSHLKVMLNAHSKGHEYSDHFAWYVLREMVSHDFSRSDRRVKHRELGVIEAGGDVVAIGHVLAGIHAGTDRNTHILQKVTYYEADTLYGATVAGSLARVIVNRKAATQKTADTMGATGAWDRSSCPPKYLLNKRITLDQHTTRAELLGDIDGFVLGERLAVWLERDPGLKLSTVLELYYGTGINHVSKDVRFDQFQTLSIDQDNIIKQTKLACKDILLKAAPFYLTLSYDHKFCKQAAKEAVEKFFNLMLPASLASSYLPGYGTLVKAYPGKIKESDLRRQISGSLQIPTGRAATEALRLSMMLNKMAGHHITLTQAKGAVIGRDKKVYIHDLTALKTYLTQKYKAPETATSMSVFSGKRGILILDPSDGNVGSVGLWDGSKMHEIPDRQTSVTKKAYMWTQKDCDSLVEQGKCEFYKCEESAFPCEKDGYALSYGFRYCDRFSRFLKDFDSLGRAWVNDVRKCLMKKLMPLYNRGFDCDTIKRTAFATHVDCYLNNGFCKISSTRKNIKALYKVYEPKDFFGKDAGEAWLQVLKTLYGCGTKLLKRTLFGKSEPSQIIRNDDSSKCVAYANAGDCRFYQCFHEKFPCSVFDTSHMTDLEHPLCKDMERQSDLLDSKGNTWLRQNNQCLMRKLLPLYNGDSINCADLPTITFQNRVVCLADASYGSIMDIGNRFALDRFTNPEGYPVLLPDKAGLTIAGRDYFYGELSSIRHLMGNKAFTTRNEQRTT